MWQFIGLNRDKGVRNPKPLPTPGKGAHGHYKRSTPHLAFDMGVGVVESLVGKKAVPKHDSHLGNVSEA